jgi:hypothetical protein
MRFVEYRHPVAGFTMELPEAWERVDSVAGVALITVEPERDGWFRSSIVVTIEQLASSTTFTQWTEAADGLVREALHRYLLIDSEPVEIGGHAARRTLAHHTTEDNHAVTMEQWILAEGGCGYTLTASAGTLDYDHIADMFGVIANGFRPGPGYKP